MSASGRTAGRRGCRRSAGSGSAAGRRGRRRCRRSSGTEPAAKPLPGSWRSRARISPQISARTVGDEREFEGDHRTRSGPRRSGSTSCATSKYWSMISFIASPRLGSGYRASREGAPCRRPFKLAVCCRLAGSGRFVGRGADPRRHRLVEPLRRRSSRRSPSSMTSSRPSLSSFEQLFVALRDDESILFFGRDRRLRFRGPLSASTAFSATGRSITTASIVPAFERVDRVGALGVGAEFLGRRFLLRRIPRRSCPAGRRRRGAFEVFDRCSGPSCPF